MDELKIGGYVGYQASTLGLDSLDQCYSKSLFKNFPHSVSYQFNSLGYRDRDISEYIKNPVIVIGDSFTVGLGLPNEMTYPCLLEKLIHHQVLNFSLNGASNTWISRKLELILKYFSPMAVIVHYTFSARRELDEPTWTDDERTLSEPIYTDQENYNDWLTNHKKIQALVVDIPTLYSFIPHWHTDVDQVRNLENCIRFTQIDLARDGFHYGVQTSKNLADLFAENIKKL